MLEKLTRPIHAPERRKVLDAIGSLGFKVVPHEVAAATGLSLSTVNLELVAIANDFDGHLRVGDKGTITYVFSPQFEANYYLHGARGILRTSLRVLGNIAITLAKVTVLVATILFRMSVGILLILSVLAVFALILIVIVRALAGDGDGIGVGDIGDLGGIAADAGSAAGSASDAATSVVSSSGDLGYWMFRWMWDWWWWHDYFYPPTYQDPVRIEDRASSFADDPARQIGRKNDFVSNCFSLVFGEGNPNANFDEQYWIAIGKVIQENKGVVTAEQLAPVTGCDSENEDWMLPVLVRFNGSPSVTDSGGIIYVFPGYASSANKVDSPLALGIKNEPEIDSVSDPLRAIYTRHLKIQRAGAAAPARTASSSPRGKLLLEREHTFCAARPKDLIGVVFFASFELMGSIWLLSTMHSFTFLVPFKPLILCLLGYGIFLFTVPVVRWFIVQAVNSRIAARNEKRIGLALKVKSPDSKLSAKLEEARSVRLEVALASTDDAIVYTSERDLLEQCFEPIAGPLTESGNGSGLTKNF